MINRVVLVGRMVRDPEMKYTPSGSAVTNFALAANRRFNKEETDFVPIVLWKQNAEYAANYGAKGRLVGIDGRLQIRNYTDKDGNKRTVAEVVADDIRFLDKQQAQGYEADPLNQAGQADSWKDVGREQDEEPY